MIKFSIIINTHSQSKYIHHAINSCLKQTYKNYEILIIDSSPQRINLVKSLNSKKKIKYVHIKSPHKHPEINQMKKIIKGYEQSTGDYILFLDGDDFFHKKKLSELNTLIIERKIICNQDLPILFKNSIKKTMLKKNYKNKFFTKYLLNNWPQIYGTSSIMIKRDFLSRYLNNANPLNWKYLAIDAQLILFCTKHKIQSNYLEGCTFKRLHNKNLGSSYMNIFKKIFWSRRHMQFEYCEYIKYNNNFSLDYFITKLIYLIFKYL